MDGKHFVDLKDLVFSACSIYNDTMFFFTEKGNILLKMDMHDYKMELLFYDDKTSNTAGESTAFLLNDGDSIYRLQLNGKKLIEYELSSNKTFTYEINESKGAWGNFSYMTIYNSCLYVFPGQVEKLIIIDLQNRAIIDKIDISRQKDKTERIDRKDFYWKRGYRLDNESVMLYSRDRREVFTYDLKSKDYKFISLPIEIQGVIDICQAEKSVYLLDDQNNLYEWDYVQNELELITKFTEAYDKSYFGKIINTNRKIILLPALGENIYFWDKSNKSYSVYQEYPDDFEYIGDKEWAKYINGCLMGDYVYFPMRRSCYILRIHRKTGDLEWIKPVPILKEDRIRYYMGKNIKYFHEGAISLEEFIGIVQSIIEV